MTKKGYLILGIIIGLVIGTLIFLCYNSNYRVFTATDNNINPNYEEELEEDNMVLNSAEEIIIPKEPTMEFAILPLDSREEELEVFYESLRIEFTDKIDDIVLIIKDEFATQISTHQKLLQKYLNDKKISTIYLPANNFELTLELIDELMNEYENNSILFLNISDLSQIDITSYKNLHNTKTFYTLNNSTSKEDYETLEVSCPTCLLLTNSLAERNNKYPHKFKENPEYIYYAPSKKEDAGITIAFFGDLMFDRDVAEILTTKERFNRFFRDFFPNGDNTLDLNTNKTRKLFGIDFVGANLETPVVTELDECTYSEKSIKFCSLDTFLPWIKNLGFNIFSLANNHSMDGGVSGHNATIRNLEDTTLNYFGYVRHGQYLEENYVQSGSVRGIDVAWHSYDFTITKYLMDNYCESLNDYRDNGYLNFVSVHWGEEYKLVHNATQEEYAKKLIDCGASLIIGHHPHVIEDIGEYNSVPIIYSLGNFLFDQDWSEETQLGIGALIDYNLNGEVSIITEERDVAVDRDLINY